MKKIFTLALAAAATVAAGAAPADVTFVNKGNKATLANQVQVERFNPIACRRRRPRRRICRRMFRNYPQLHWR